MGRGVDIVVCNAGIGAAATLKDARSDLWRKALEVNATSGFLPTKAMWLVLERPSFGAWSTSSPKTPSLRAVASGLLGEAPTGC